MVKRSKSGFRLLEVGEIDLHQLELRLERFLIGLVGEPLERVAHLLLKLCARRAGRAGEHLRELGEAGGLRGAADLREARRLIRHRLAREQKVLWALQRLASPTAEELVREVYDDVAPRLHGVALRSLSAHLEKLAAEGRARAADGRWSLVQSSTVE